MGLFRIVTYVLRDCGQFGLKPGYCIMAVRPMTPADVEGERTLHRLKCWPEFYEALEREEKTFELRKDDREPRFAVGDVLELERFPPPIPTPKGGKTP